MKILNIILISLLCFGLHAQNKVIDFTEGSDKGKIKESDLKINQSIIANESLKYTDNFIKYINYSYNFDSYGLNTNGASESDFLSGLWLNQNNPFQSFSIHVRVKLKELTGNGVAIGNGSRGGRGLFLRLVIVSGKYNLMLHKTDDGVTTTILAQTVLNDATTSINDEFDFNLLRTERNIQGSINRISDNKSLSLIYENTPQSGNLYYDAYGSPCLIFLSNWQAKDFKWINNEKGVGVWLGNSIVEGFYADENRLTFRRLVSDRISGGMINAAIGGQTTVNLLSAVQSIAVMKPKFALIETGVNDANGGNSANVFIIYSKILANELIKNGITPIFLIAQNWATSGPNTLLNQYRDSLLAYKNQYRVIDMQMCLRNPLSADIDPMYHNGDGHPNTLGNRVIADYIINNLRQTIPINSFQESYDDYKITNLGNWKEKLSKYNYLNNFMRIGLLGDSNIDNPYSWQAGFTKILNEKNIKIASSGFQSMTAVRPIGRNNLVFSGVWTTKYLTTGGKGLDGGEASTVQDGAYIETKYYADIAGTTPNISVIKVHYLQQNGGGTFNIVNQTANAILTTVNTSGSTSFQVVSVSLPTEGAYDIRIISTSTSPLTIYGLETISNGTSACIVDKIGVSGSTSKDWYNNLKNGYLSQGISAINPSLVVIALGTNDPYYSNEVEKYKTSLIAIVKDIQAKNIDVVLVAPAQDERINTITTSITAYDSAAIEVARITNCSYLDFGKMLGSVTSQLQKGLKETDKIHYTTYGGYNNAKIFYDLFFQNLGRDNFTLDANKKISQTSQQLGYTSNQNDANVSYKIADNTLWLGILLNRRSIIASTRDGISHYGINLAPYAGGLQIGGLGDATAPLHILGTGFSHDMVDIQGNVGEDTRVRYINGGVTRAWTGLTSSSGTGFLGNVLPNSFGIRGDNGVYIGVSGLWGFRMNTNLTSDFASNVAINGQLSATSGLFTGILNQTYNDNDIFTFNNTNSNVDSRIRFQRNGNSSAWVGLTNSTSSMFTGAGQDLLAFRGDNGILFGNGATFAQKIVGNEIFNLNISIDNTATHVQVIDNLGKLGKRAISSLPSTSQVNSDWNATSGLSQILNKPDLTQYASKTANNVFSGNQSHTGLVDFNNSVTVQNPITSLNPTNKLYVDNGILNAIWDVNEQIFSVTANIPTGGIFTSNVSGTGASNTQATRVASDNYGRIACATGTTATGRAGLITSGNAILFEAGKSYIFDLKGFRIPTILTASASIFLGFGDGLTAEPVDGAYFKIDNLSTNITCATSSNLVRTNSGAGIFNYVANTDYNLRIVATSTGVSFFINNMTTPVFVSTTNLPILPGREFGIMAIIVASAGLTNQSFQLDDIKVKIY
jgi:hypothetical protein